MKVDIYHAADRVLLVLDGKGIPNLTGTGKEFIKGMEFERQVDFQDLPSGLKKGDVKKSLTERGYFAARSVVTITEVEIQEQ